MQFPSCAVVPFTTPGGTGRAILTSEGVTVIESPPGTLTDRGVGDGSTVAQIESVYGNDHSTRTIQTESGQSIFVTTGDPGQVGNGDPGGLIGFSIHDGTVGPPVIGGVPGFEYCSGNSSTSTSRLPTASTSEGCGTITYPETGVVAAIGNLQGGITCEVAKDIVWSARTELVESVFRQSRRSAGGAPRLALNRHVLRDYPVDQTSSRSGSAIVDVEARVQFGDIENREFSAGRDSVTYVLDGFEADSVGRRCADARRHSCRQDIEVDGQVDQIDVVEEVCEELIHDASADRSAFFVEQIANTEAVSRVEQCRGVARLADSDHAVLMRGACRGFVLGDLTKGCAGAGYRIAPQVEVRIQVEDSEFGSGGSQLGARDAEVCTVGDFVSSPENHGEVSRIKRSADCVPECGLTGLEFFTRHGNGSRVLNLQWFGQRHGSQPGSQSVGAIRGTAAALVAADSFVAGESDQNTVAGSCFG